ncbi:MAG: VCBS repeat-containing protein [Alphaproteobacteria bacterium]|nr:VCBS repeat-containing protein [Alphaproteobacteria bacterium]
MLCCLSYVHAFVEKSATSRSWQRLARAAALALGALAAAQPASALTGQMVTGGAGGVDIAGQFGFSIPIVAPPGTAGMVPHLSLNYSSRAGNGIAGYGWMLGGLDAITRCPKTMAIEGARGSVNYDSNDRFCLNGQHLLVSTGTYGANNSVYYTFINGYSQVTAHTTSGTDPDYFTVKLRNGTTMELGHTADSRIEASSTNSTGRAWLVNKITDTKGNYLTVTYTEDQANGDYYPTRIDYTGNAAASPALLPYNSVQFAYATTQRLDIVPSYQAGYVRKTMQLLTDIKTYAGSTLVYDYKLGYRPGTAAGLHSRLTSVTQCDAAATTCFAPTTFDWQGGTGLATANSPSSQSFANSRQLFSGDFNGDGLLDAVTIDTSCPTGGTIFAGANATPNVGSFSASGIDTYYHYWIPGNATQLLYSGDACFKLGVNFPIVGDYDADGYSDFLLDQDYSTSAGGVVSDKNITTLTRNGQSGTITQYTIPSPTLPEMAATGDFNGDGRTDGFAQIAAADGRVYASDGVGGMSYGGTIYSWGGSSNTVRAGDFDGDGCTDILAQGSTDNNIHYFCTPATATGSASGLSGTIVLGDYNGDGKTDVLTIASGGATLYLSTGTGLASGTPISGTSGWNACTAYPGDFDGDGRTDILIVCGGTTTQTIYLSTGTGFNSGSGISVTSPSSTTGASIQDWNNDGADDIWFRSPSSGDKLQTYQFVPERITAVHNGIGATTSITYDRLDQNSPFFTKSGVSGLAYPQAELDGPWYVVSRLGVDDGASVTAYHTDYTYQDGVFDMTAPPVPGPKSNLPSSFQAFSKIVKTDSRTGNLTTTTTYRTDIPFTGKPSEVDVSSGTQALTQTEIVYGDIYSGVYALQLVHTSTTRYDLNGATLPAIRYDYGYDTSNNMNGYLLRINLVNYSDVDYTFTNDTTNWVLGQLTQTTVHNTVGTSDITRTFTYTPDTSPTGLTTNAYAEQADTGRLKLEADYSYDQYGNRTTTTLQGPSFASRGSSVNWDANGEFPTGTTNALSQSTGITFDPGFGTVATTTDLNSLVTSFDIDTLGRTTGVHQPDSNQTTITYNFCSGVNGGSASCPTHGAYVVKAQPKGPLGTANGAASWTYYDSLGRVIANDVEGFSGSVIRTATQYDADGHVSQTSRPYFVSGGTAVWTTYAYDAISRVSLVTLPDASTTSYCYNGQVTSVKRRWMNGSTPVDEIKVTTLNDQGLVASTIDNASADCTATGTITGSKMSYVYDAFGNPLTITDTNGNVITNTFDLRGRRTGMTDPDMGGTTHAWSYVVDGLGQLKSQTDANGLTMAFTYDALSRVTTRQDGGTTTRKFFYDTTNGTGRFMSACINATCSAGNYQLTATYDSYSRLQTGKVKIDGVSNPYTYSYDTNGRLYTVAYPSGFTAKYVYNSYGYLSQIQDNSTSSTVWQANAADAEMHYTQQTAGNGVVTTAGYDADTGRVLNICASTTSGACAGDVANYSYDWDPNGNLIDRSDTWQGYTEKFCYDGMNRLVNASMTSTCTTSPRKAIAYDALAGITKKSDICTAANCYTYGGTGYGPHQLASITGNYNGVTNPTFTYDNNGNMLGGAGFTMSYTAANRMTTLSEGTNAVELLYGAFENRYKMCVPNCTSATTTTSYLYDPMTGAMSDKVVTGGTTTYNDYITVPGVGIVALRNKIGTTVSWYYTALDHLGSISAITDASKAISERLSYDPWGKRRNANGTDNSACSITSLTTRGYTGHEMLDSFCLINMNARTYDPSLGRFQGADSIIPDPGYSQAYNRYAYVYDNPLNDTDPTGHTGDTYCGIWCWVMTNIDPPRHEGGFGLLNFLSGGSGRGDVFEHDLGGFSRIASVATIDLAGSAEGSALFWFPGSAESSSFGTTLSKLGNMWDQRAPTQQYLAFKLLYHKSQVWACNAGNSLEDLSAKLGDASADVEIVGVGVFVGGLVIDQEEISAAGIGMMSAGGYGGMDAGGLQIIGGLFQGYGGGDWENAAHGAATLGMSAFISGIGMKAYPNTVAGRKISAALENSGIMSGAMYDLVVAKLGVLGPKQVACPH